MTRAPWLVDRDVQLGVEVEGQASLFWTLFGHNAEVRERLGAEVRSIVARANEAGSRPLGDEAIGEQVLNALDVATDQYAGVWATLDRQGCNQLVRVLRRARDSAFGRDE